jgi:hypothetical protein
MAHANCATIKASAASKIENFFDFITFSFE